MVWFEESSSCLRNHPAQIFKSRSLFLSLSLSPLLSCIWCGDSCVCPSSQLCSAVEIAARLPLRAQMSRSEQIYRSLCCRPNTCGWHKFTSLRCCVSSKWRLSEPRSAVHLATANTEPKHNCVLITSMVIWILFLLVVFSEWSITIIIMYIGLVI